MNTSEHSSYDTLKPQHQLAVDLRCRGMKYDEIASNSHIDTKEHTVRTWFMKGGICYEAYQEKKQQLQAERKERLKVIEAGITDLAGEALKVLQEAVEKKNLKAAITVMEMAGFKAVQKVQEMPTEENETVTLLREIAENYKQKEE